MLLFSHCIAKLVMLCYKVVYRHMLIQSLYGNTYSLGLKRRGSCVRITVSVRSVLGQGRIFIFFH